MDSTIDLDIIAFASDLALTINVVGALIFALVMRRLWVAAGRGTRSSARQSWAAQSRSTAKSCPAL